MGGEGREGREGGEGGGRQVGEECEGSRYYVRS